MVSIIITERKRSMGQGNIYRPQTKFAKVMFLQVSVILSTGGACVVALGGMHGCSGGGVACVVAQGGMCGCLGACVVALGGHGGCAWLLWGGHVWLLGGGMCGCFQGGLGMRGCSGGAWMVAPGGACVVAPGGHVWLLRGGVHVCFFRWDTVNEWAVRILLECILVSQVFVCPGGVSVWCHFLSGCLVPCSFGVVCVQRGVCIRGRISIQGGSE